MAAPPRKTSIHRENIEDIHSVVKNLIKLNATDIIMSGTSDRQRRQQDFKRQKALFLEEMKKPIPKLRGQSADPQKAHSVDKYGMPPGASTWSSVDSDFPQPRFPPDFKASDLAKLDSLRRSESLRSSRNKEEASTRQRENSEGETENKDGYKRGPSSDRGFESGIEDGDDSLHESLLDCSEGSDKAPEFKNLKPIPEHNDGESRDDQPVSESGILTRESSVSSSEPEILEPPEINSETDFVFDHCDFEQCSTEVVIEAKPVPITEKCKASFREVRPPPPKKIEPKKADTPPPPKKIDPPPPMKKVDLPPPPKKVEPKKSDPPVCQVEPPKPVPHLIFGEKKQKPAAEKDEEQQKKTLKSVKPKDTTTQPKKASTCEVALKPVKPRNPPKLEPSSEVKPAAPEPKANETIPEQSSNSNQLSVSNSETRVFTPRSILRALTPKRLQGTAHHPDIHVEGPASFIRRRSPPRTRSTSITEQNFKSCLPTVKLRPTRLVRTQTAPLFPSRKKENPFETVTLKPVKQLLFGGNSGEREHWKRRPPVKPKNWQKSEVEAEENYEEDEEEVPAEEDEPEEQEVAPKRHVPPPREPDEPQLTEAEQAMLAAKKKHDAEEEERLREYEEMRAEQREKEDAELQELKEKQARRKEERQEEARIIAERAQAEENRRRQEEEERKQRMEEEKRKRDERKKKVGGGGIPGFSGPATGPNFVVNKKEKGEKKGPVGKAGPTKEELEAKKIEFLAANCPNPNLQSLGIDGLKEKVKELHARICKLEADKYDLEKRHEGQEYDLKELFERGRQQARNKALAKGLDPEEAANSVHPPKVKVQSKFDRQVDSRDYTERRTLYNEPKINIVTKYDRQIDRRPYGERREVYQVKNAFPHFPNMLPPEQALKKRKFDEDGQEIIEEGEEAEVLQKPKPKTYATPAPAETEEPPKKPEVKVFHGSSRPPTEWGRTAQMEELELVRKNLEAPKYQEAAPIEGAKPPMAAIPAQPLPELGPEDLPPQKKKVAAPIPREPEPEPEPEPEADEEEEDEEEEE